MGLVKSLVADAGEEMPEASTSFEENAKEVAGVSFAKTSTQLPQGDMMQTMISNFAFGPEGPSGYVGVINDETMVAVGGLSDEQITTVVEAAEAGESPLTDKPGMDLMAKHLPEQQSAVFFWDVAETARAGLGALQAFGQAPPVQIPQDLPPVGVAAGPDEDSLRIGILVPKDLVSAAIATSMQFEQGMGGPPDQGL